MGQHTAPAPVLSTGAGAAARAERSRTLDTWLSRVYADAGGTDTGTALVAVGGLGRRECAPKSDLDLVLVHDAGVDAEALATDIWYAVWDAKFALDQSMRTPEQALKLATEDLKVAVGLLDARLVAGDAVLMSQLHDDAVTQWRA